MYTPNFIVGSRYKAVYVLENTSMGLGESTSFVILDHPLTVTTNKNSYFIGETVVVSFSSDVGATLRSNDRIYIVPEDEDDYSRMISIADQRTFQTESSGTINLYTPSYMVGSRYKAVYIIESSTRSLGEST
eukprot:CAMPEP_0116548870 /NCGR_PEP_ID=MMETSP0397-20121206/4573_1 /TAXON_ID=216820 /ORGANISM="Cyclophora tenuis, Strain ECT3854" /LENGTH=131 /DNA_ID=CAMNT_0004073561 /DNA_START=325 /DNA_END=717 /DNA_ORIENTATION=-